MNKPKMDYYFVFVWGCVEPELIGPFSSFDEMKAAAAREYRKSGSDENAYFHLSVPQGAKAEIGSFIEEFDEEESEDENTESATTE